MLLGWLYGLADASCAWWKALSKRMSELGFAQLTIDVALFVAYNATDKIICACGAHDVSGGDDGQD